MSGYTYLDTTPIDDGTPYYVDWKSVDRGSADAREPQIIGTAGGNYEVYPLLTAYSPRKGKLRAYANCTDERNKRFVETTLKALMNGQRRLHLAGQWIDVYLFGSKEVDDASKTAATAIGVEASFVAGVPLWSYNQPLNGLAPNPVYNPGDPYALVDDGSLPALIPAFSFTTASFTLNNWGTAFTFASGTITGGPTGDGVNPTVYLHNTTSGAPSARLPVVLNASGNGVLPGQPAYQPWSSLTAYTVGAAVTYGGLSWGAIQAGTNHAPAAGSAYWAQNTIGEFYLAPGNNTIVVENLAGAAIAPGGLFVIEFGATYMRFL